MAGEWGQAAVNNSVGFGQGAGNSTEGWGTIHAVSFGHPQTNLVGGPAFEQEYQDWLEALDLAGIPRPDLAYSAVQNAYIKSMKDAGLLSKMLWISFFTGTIGNAPLVNVLNPLQVGTPQEPNAPLRRGLKGWGNGTGVPTSWIRIPCPAISRYEWSFHVGTNNASNALWAVGGSTDGTLNQQRTALYGFLSNNVFGLVWNSAQAGLQLSNPVVPITERSFVAAANSTTAASITAGSTDDNLAGAAPAIGTMGQPGTFMGILQRCMYDIGTVNGNLPNNAADLFLWGVGTSMTPAQVDQAASILQTFVDDTRAL